MRPRAFSASLTSGLRLERLLKVLRVNSRLASLRPSHLRSLGSVHLHEIGLGRASVEGKEARALSIESYDSIKYLYRDEIEFSLTKLRNLLYKRPSEIASGRVATVLADALRSYFDQLREIAREIDEEYASEPEPVVRP